MNNQIVVSYDEKTKRLVMKSGFHLADAMREYPSRRFNPKDKSWRMPLVKANVTHFNETKHRYDYKLEDDAMQALTFFNESQNKPKYVPFPRHIYDFKKSKMGYLPMEHQNKMLDLSWGLPASAIFAKMGCVAGDTELQVLLGAGKGRKIKISDLFRTNSSRIRCRVFKGDHFGQHDCVEVLQSGVKPVWKITTSCGKSLKATADHPILTSEGFIEIKNLVLGDQVVTFEGTEKYLRPATQEIVPIQGSRSVDSDGYIRCYRPDHPRAWQHTGSVYEHVLVAEENLGRPLEDDEIVHHKNRIKHDNRWDNLEVLKEVDHLKVHGKEYGHNFPGRRPFLSSIVSIEFVGTEMTYDLSMEHPYHNYVANGIVVHNTGKTFAAVHTAMARWKCGEIDAVMIVCPSTLRRTWMKELAKYATCEYDFRIHDTKAPWLRDFYNAMPKDKLPILAVSVEGLGVSEALFNSADAFLSGRRVLTICDESSRIKNPQAKRTQRCIELGARSKYRMILNGTPIALGIHDLWAQYEFLDPNIIGCGDYWAFKTRYIVMGGYENKQIVGVQNVDELMNAIIPYTCEVGKDVLNLPPKMMKPIYMEATPEQKALFRLIVKGTTGDPNEPLIKVDNVLERMLRLRQVVGGYLPRGVRITKVIDGLECEVIETVIEPLKENPKLDTMLTMIEDNYTGTKFIIWTTFIHEIEHIRDILTKEYGKEAVECYYGETRMEDRSRVEDRYCNDPTLRFFIGNPVAAGLGLTLISGENDVMVYYSGTNAYIDRAQSEDRAHRIGQENQVTVVDLVMGGTVDELIQASIAEKMDVEAFIVERIKAGVNLDDLLLGNID